jgi:hypothetical protein
MQGLLNPPEGHQPFDTGGWFPTGDLMEQDEDGFIRMVDRKKEIYKNINGQTIAPQKIENLFRDFDSVGRIFLVGDHRAYNTALIYPNPEDDALDLEALSPEELKGHFRSLVVSANSFLAPFERIVDFAVIDRDFDAEQGELTAKGTFRRKTIESAFADEIRLLYRRRRLSVGGVEVIVPNWFFQVLGITTQELRVGDDALYLSSLGTSLTIRDEGEDVVRIGSVFYRPGGRAINLGHLLSTPLLWVGNDELVNFAPLEPGHRDRRRRRSVSPEWLPRSPAPTRRRHAHRARAPGPPSRRGFGIGRRPASRLPGPCIRRDRDPLPTDPHELSRSRRGAPRCRNRLRPRRPRSVTRSGRRVPGRGGVSLPKLGRGVGPGLARDVRFPVELRRHPSHPIQPPARLLYPRRHDRPPPRGAGTCR